MIRDLLLAVVLALASCSTSSNAPASNRPNANSEATPEAAPEVPVRVRWKVLSDAGGRLAMDAIVERRAALQFPIRVHVEVPAGVTVLSGPSQFEVPADGQVGESAVRIEFAYSGTPPANDLKLVADAAGAGMGIHATDAYRFGRKVDVTRPEPRGPAVKVGEKDLGPAVPLGDK